VNWIIFETRKPKSANRKAQLVHGAMRTEHRATVSEFRIQHS
jgi:hypothetical protein